MVKVTLEYSSVEEAIVALGRLAQVAKVRRAAQGTVGAPAPEEERTDKAVTLAPVAPATKKARGRPRKQEAKEPAASGSSTTDPAVAAALPPASAPAAVSEAPAEELSPAAQLDLTPTGEAAKAALEAYFEKHGAQKAMKVLADFGVSRLRDLPEGERTAFIKACQ